MDCTKRRMGVARLLTAGLAAGFLGTTTWAGGADLVINEIRIDQPGSDIDEYFELSGTPGASLDGLTYVVIGDGTGGSGVIESNGAIDLTGQVLDANGFFVAAEASFTLGTANLTTTLGFENGDNTTHLLVTGFTGAPGDDLDTDDDGVLDITPWTSIVDLIAVIEEENPPSGTEYHYGPPAVGPDGPFAPAHVYRCETDGTWTIGAFDPADGTDTPGATNLACVVNAKLELRLLGSGPYAAGAQIDIALWMADLGDNLAAGFQTFLQFDTKAMSFLDSSDYTDAPFGVAIIPLSAIGENIDLAAGVDFLNGQDPTGDDSKLALLRFEALTDIEGDPPIFFRDNNPPSRISDDGGIAIEPLELVVFPPACPADISGFANNPDGEVSFPDLLRVLSNWGPCAAPCPPDINCDGEVSFQDLLIVLSTWGPCPS